ncbi:GNAT family N-acetyltransferase [Miltoncostaea marina]|uniref:GNAT family N-acetyltransferase n=1 Tax=Miltoncostaea marina TaxID=2843215 RepID=UPI001C3D93EC|nr:GNAT family N-acetyltransferase [Miltoncostaea marina]
MGHTLHYIQSAPLAAGAATYGMTSLWRRAGTLRQAYRRHGLLGAAIAVAGRVPDGLLHAQWYSVHETLPPVAGPGAPGLETRRAGAADLPLLAGLGRAPEAELRERLAGGDRGYIGLIDGAPVGYYWFRAGAWQEDDIRFVLEPDERWAYDAFVVPGARGRNIASAMAIHALGELQGEGVRRVVSVIDHLNEPSLRAAGRHGAHPIASFLTIGVPGLGLLHERRTGARRPSLRLYRRSAGLTRRPPPSPAA